LRPGQPERLQPAIDHLAQQAGGIGQQEADTLIFVMDNHPAILRR
jgi:hypothetical protein